MHKPSNQGRFLLSIVLIFLTGTPVMANTLNCPCRVVEVMAGDAVYVVDSEQNSRKIWLSGIDAPQLEQLYGKQARSNLSSLVLDQYVNLETMQSDRYGRITARLIKDNLDINLQQIKSGYAWFYPNDINLPEQFKRIYSEAELQARKDTLGLWESNAVAPWDFRNK